MSFEDLDFTGMGERVFFLMTAGCNNCGALLQVGSEVVAQYHHKDGSVADLSVRSRLEALVLPVSSTHYMPMPIPHCPVCMPGLELEITLKVEDD